MTYAVPSCINKLVRKCESCLERRDVGENTEHVFTAMVSQGLCKHVCTDMSHLQWNASYHISHQNLSILESISLCTIIQFQHLSLSAINIALFSTMLKTQYG